MLCKRQNAYSILQKHVLQMWHWEEGNCTHCWDSSAFAHVVTITLINFSSRRTQVFFLLGIFGKKRVLVIASQVDFRNCNSQDPAEGRKLLLIKTGHEARKIGNIIQLDHFLEEATSSKSHVMFNKETQTQPEGFSYSSSLVRPGCFFNVSRRESNRQWKVKSLKKTCDLQVVSHIFINCRSVDIHPLKTEYLSQILGALKNHNTITKTNLTDKLHLGITKLQFSFPLLSYSHR